MSEKKALIVSYYWPPAGGPGVQRWLKFAKYLPSFGWQPTVFVPENPSYPLLDDSLAKDIPEGLDVIKTKIWEPYQLAEKLSKRNKKFKGGQFDVGQNQNWKSRLSIWVRGNFFIPDARVFWVKPSVKYLKKYLSENQVDVLVTTGPPHSLHLIGLNLKKEFPKLKWVADFRDPWTEISYYKHLKLTQWADKKHRWLERQVFENADVTLATSFTDAENFKKKGANALCVTNGFDDDEMQCENQQATEKFTLSYIGVLEQLRNPEILWEILAELMTEDAEFAKDFELKFAGRIDDKILEQLQKLGLQKIIKNLGYISHDRALQEMRNSNLLLITNFPKESSKGIIPGKIFEYLATGKRIISFGPYDADVAKILTETNAGQHFSYSDKTPVKHFLKAQYSNWKSENINENQSNIMQFSRRKLTERLSQILEN